MFDEYAYVIEKKGMNAKVIGSKNFTPLEVILRKGTETEIGEKLYIGKEKREKVYSIRRKLHQKDLQNVLEIDFQNVLEKIVKENEEFFINFINNAKPLTIKRHQLQLLPNIGEKHFKKIIEEREKQEFKSFDDFQKRTDLNIVNILALRLYDEFTKPEEKIKLFVKIN